MSKWNGWVALWHGGANYSVPEWNDAEYVNTIADAIEIVRDRMDNGGWRRLPFEFIFHAPDSFLVPVAHSDNSGGMWLYKFDRNATVDDIRERLSGPDPYPDALIEIGPRGGIRKVNA